MSAEGFLCEAIALARDNVRAGGRPFGAVLVKEGRVIATGVNEVFATGDPTTHSELPRLDGCVIYASGHPCPMCLAAMHLTGIAEVAYAYSLADGEPYGLSTAAIYAEMARPLAAQSLKAVHMPVRIAGEDPYEMWKARTKA